MDSARPAPPAGLMARARGGLARLGLLPGAQPGVGDHAGERQRRILLSAGMALAARLVTVLTGLISVPLTLHYLGTERYGMWMVISSLSAMLAFADLGIGNGVLNAVASAFGRDDLPGLRRAVASGCAALLVVALVVLAVFALAYRHVAWPALFNVQSPGARAEAGPAIVAFFMCFVAAIPATIVQRVQYGLQRGFLASAWQCAGSLLSLGLVLAVIARRGGLPDLVLALLGGPLLANVINTVIFFGFSRRDIRPRLADVSGAAARQVMGTGLTFLLLQITTTLIFSADSLVITQVLGPGAVAQHAIADRMFSVISIGVGIMLAPLWPAYREALERRDVGWVRQVLRRSMGLAIACSVAIALPFTLFARPIVHLWLGRSLEIPGMLFLGFGLWKVVESYSYAVAMFLNGANLIRQQLIFAIPAALASIALSVFLTHHVGVWGVIWARLIAIGLIAVVPYTLLTLNFIKSLKEPGG